MIRPMNRLKPMAFLSVSYTISFGGIRLSSLLIASTYVITPSTMV